MGDDVPGTEFETVQEDQGSSPSTLWLVLAAVVIIGIVLWLLASCVGTQIFEEDLSQSANAVVVPDVVGMHRDDAVIKLTGVGFDVTIRKQASDDEPVGTVLRQSPTAGTEASVGITVIIEIADGPVVPDEPPVVQYPDTVPLVVGAQEDEAIHKIEMAGYQASVSYVQDGIAPPAKVLTQYPEAGTEAPSGTVVHISVALAEQAPATVTVPDIEGLSVAEAESRIRAVGLEPFAMERPRPTPYGVASDQWPEPGEVLDSGEKVYFSYGFQSNY